MPVNSFDHYPLSWKPDRKQLEKPYYRSLYRDLEQKILSGELPEGTKLPPQRELADFLDLNYSTITRVYNYCRKKGLIYGITGSGTFVAPHASSSITIDGPQSGDSLIEMGFISGFPELSKPVERAIHEIIKKKYLKNLLSYEYPYGFPHHRSRASDWLSCLGVSADPDHTAIFSGAENALTIALLSLFHPGDRIAVDSYTYSNFIELARMTGLQLVPVDGDEKGMVPSALEEACLKAMVKGIYLMPDGSNPTNMFLPLSRKKELAHVIRTFQLRLIEDDLYGWMRLAEGKELTPFHELLGEGVFYIASLTKCLSPGLRIAYGAFTEDLKDEILKGLSIINIKTSSLDAEIMNQLLLSGDGQQLISQKLSLAQKACRLFDRIFPDVPPQGTSYFRWLPIPGDRAFDQVEKELSGIGIHAYHSGRFLVSPHEKQSYLRISLSSAGSFTRLEKGLLLLKNWRDEKMKSEKFK